MLYEFELGYNAKNIFWVKGDQSAVDYKKKKKDV